MLPSSEQTLKKKKKKKKMNTLSLPPISPPHTKKAKTKKCIKNNKIPKEYLGLSLFFSSDEII